MKILTLLTNIEDMGSKLTEIEYIENSIARIQAYNAGMCMGANLKGLNGGEWHYDDGERGRQEIEKEIKRLIKYIKKFK